MLEKFLEVFVSETGTKAYENYRSKKEKEATQILRQILLGEFSTGRYSITHLNEDVLFESLYRYERAVKEGIANSNLRLMAEIIKGTVCNGETTSDRCIYLQSIVSEMTREEIFLATKLYLNSKKALEENQSSYHLTAKELVGSVYPNEASYIAALARLTRTGLVIPQSAYSAIIYDTSPLMDELYKLCDLQVFNNIQ